MNPTSFRSRSKSHFFHYIKPYTVHFQDTENPKGKPKIRQKIVNQNGVFHKIPSTHFYLIGTFSGPNPLSLKFLIMCLLTVIDLTEENGQKSSLGSFCFKVFILASFFFSVFHFSFNLVFFVLFYVYMFAQVSFIVSFMFRAYQVSRFTFSVLLCFCSIFLFGLLLDQGF